MRFYLFHLKHRSHPGMVYSWLPALVDHYGMDDEQKAWLVWLNGNTQNPVTTKLLLDAAPRPADWPKAAELVDTHFKNLAWDTDRRYFKSKFGVATQAWDDVRGPGASDWLETAELGWDAVWRHAARQPFMGRLSAWSMIEYARIVFGSVIPDAETMLLDDAGSQSHFNGLALVAGHDSVYWKDRPHELRPELEALADDLLTEALTRLSPFHLREHVTRLTLESALCTYKGWHKPQRRYPNVYADMAFDRLLWAEERWGPRFDVLWNARERDLPDYLRLECDSRDPGCVPVKQDHYRLTGEPIMMHHDYPDMRNHFNAAVDRSDFGTRESWTRWTLT